MERKCETCNDCPDDDRPCGSPLYPCWTPKIGLLISVIKNKDGLWLSFNSVSGKSAIVNVNKLLTGSGTIIDKAVLEACEEAAQSLEAATRAPNNAKAGSEALDPNGENK